MYVQYIVDSNVRILGEEYLLDVAIFFFIYGNPMSKVKIHIYRPDLPWVWQWPGGVRLPRAEAIGYSVVSCRECDRRGRARRGILIKTIISRNSFYLLGIFSNLVSSPGRSDPVRVLRRQVPPERGGGCAPARTEQVVAGAVKGPGKLNLHVA